MFYKRFLLVTALLLVLSGRAVYAQSDISSTSTLPDPLAVSNFLSIYKLGSGDVISIQVFGEEDLSREKVRLTDTGTVFMPGLGELSVRGKTLGDVERMIADGLRGRILVNPKVSVYVEEYRPFFINGMVDKPGGFPFQPGLTVRKAAALAGGFKERASLNKLYLIRGDDPRQVQVKVNLNTPVFPGDIITVEESFF
ncbi:polysaccharide biosynthesis/export family protein [Uliginosibacterium sediminicola]|uniref:Polysaccharide biosynthesis/export family protein n=1 Tax=Uliginosibacterium sediminicola TaxID=2024550 RepID=A0ABU9Z001_9RHOO